MLPILLPFDTSCPNSLLRDCATQTAIYYYPRNTYLVIRDKCYPILQPHPQDACCPPPYCPTCYSAEQAVIECIFDPYALMKCTDHKFIFLLVCLWAEKLYFQTDRFYENLPCWARNEDLHAWICRLASSLENVLFWTSKQISELLDNFHKYSLYDYSNNPLFIWKRTLTLQATYNLRKPTIEYIIGSQKLAGHRALSVHTVSIIAFAHMFRKLAPVKLSTARASQRF